MERIYKTMKGSGIINIVLGITMIVVSALCGSFLIVTGARLLVRKNDITF